MRRCVLHGEPVFLRFILFSDRNGLSARSEEESLRDEIPQAGLGGSPTYSHMAKPFRQSSQGAKRYLTGYKLMAVSI